tara:strand:- start:673 stop:1230 length:558 start_codon:yes stop_codon:yes gene_type:complete
LSKNKGFSNTSANRYSLALYELAEDSNLLSKIEMNSVSILNLIGTSVDFNNLIKDPTVSRNELINAINKIFDYLKIENLLKNFTNFLVTKRRFFFIEQILNNFIEICSEKRGELKTEIRSAKNLSNDEINNIKDELSKHFTSKIKLDYKYDESLIGGLIVQVGSTMIDTSIKNKLQQIENKMMKA